jgi:UDP-N-acetylmuramoyl-tripeptide--D-alanyl-D-alanine ligase
MMDTLTAARAVQGRLIGTPINFTRVTSDTRQIAQGDLFVALKGERFDGHDFVSQAFAAGAVAAIVAEKRASHLSGTLIAVADPLRALAALAAYWRGRYTLPVAAVVGSNGKTTTKEMIATIFRAAVTPAHVLATAGNLNNAIGLPLTVLSLRSDHALAVLEIGMNHRGETRELAAVAQPTIAVITNAQREHQEFMRSVADVAAEHADLVHALPAGGMAVINGDDAHADVWRDAARAANARTLQFGFSKDAAVTATFALRGTGSDLTLSTPLGRIETTLSVPGRFMIMNALGATAVALAAGVAPAAIARGLADFRAVSGRLAARSTARGALVIDDTYNANPDSVRAAIDVLAAAPGQKWLVLGDMGEVGTQGPAFHREVGEYARAAGIDRLLATGVLVAESISAFGVGAMHAPTVEALAQQLVDEADAGVTVLVKGSRFMRMERVVAALTGESGSAH